MSLRTFVLSLIFCLGFCVGTCVDQVAHAEEGDPTYCRGFEGIVECWEGQGLECAACLEEGTPSPFPGIVYSSTAAANGEAAAREAEVEIERLRKLLVLTASTSSELVLDAKRQGHYWKDRARRDLWEKPWFWAGLLVLSAWGGFEVCRAVDC